MPSDMSFTGGILPEVVGRKGCQRVPQCRPRSQPHRHGYSAVIGAVGHATISPDGGFADEAFSDALLKHDLAAGTVQAREFGKDATVVLIGMAVIMGVATFVALRGLRRGVQEDMDEGVAPLEDEFRTYPAS
jgi:hypothetical protein